MKKKEKEREKQRQRGTDIERDREYDTFAQRNLKLCQLLEKSV